MFFVFSRTWDEEKIMKIIPHEDFLFAPRSWHDEKHLFVWLIIKSTFQTLDLSNLDNCSAVLKK